MNNKINVKTEKTNATAERTNDSAGGCNSPPISSRSTMITAINAYHPVTTVTPSSKADHIGITNTAHDVVTSSTFVTAVEEIVHKSMKDCVNKLTATAATGENSYITTTNTNHETTKEAKKNRVDLLLDSFIRYKTCHDCPLSGFAAKKIFQSHVECIPIKEVETDEEEPIYMMFGNDKGLKTAPSSLDKDGDDKVNCKCNDCNFQDECEEYTYGPYCVTAVKRYFDENKYNTSLRCAYQVYVAHYNRVLDFHSYNPYSSSDTMRNTEVTKPTYCMREGSLKYVLFWMQWQIANGPEKEYYDEMRAKQKRIKMNKLAKQAATFRYRYAAK